MSGEIYIYKNSSRQIINLEYIYRREDKRKRGLGAEFSELAE